MRGAEFALAQREAKEIKQGPRMAPPQLTFPAPANTAPHESISALLAALLLTAMTHAQSLYDIPLKDINGKDTSLKEYKGKVLLIVNVASKCGHTPQYAGL